MGLVVFISQTVIKLLPRIIRSILVKNYLLSTIFTIVSLFNIHRYETKFSPFLNYHHIRVQVLKNLFLFRRYCDANIKMSSSYCSYATSIPEFLKNRPADLIKHCMEKIDLSQDINESYVVMTGHGKFTIKSCSRNALEDEYHLICGDENTMPNCTCYSWRRSAYLCKHFLPYSRNFRYGHGSHFQHFISIHRF